MYVLYKSKNILTFVTIEYVVGFIVGMYNEYCLWAKVAVLNHKLLYWTVWDMFMQVLYLGRGPRTKETLPDFCEKCRVTRHSRVFRGLTGSQRTPGIWGVTFKILKFQILFKNPKISKLQFQTFQTYDYFYNFYKMKSCGVNCVTNKWAWWGPTFHVSF